MYNLVLNQGTIYIKLKAVLSTNQPLKLMKNHGKKTLNKKNSTNFFPCELEWATNS